MIRKLKFKLYKNSKNNYNDLKNIQTDFLRNRDVEDPEQYLSLDRSVVLDYNLLDNMDKAVELFVNHYNNNDKIQILVDEDVDDISLIGALYGKDGKLVEIKTVPVANVEKGKYLESEITFDKSIKENNLKVFMWDSLGGMTALCENAQ